MSGITPTSVPANNGKEASSRVPEDPVLQRLATAQAIRAHRDEAVQRGGSPNSLDYQLHSDRIVELMKEARDIVVQSDRDFAAAVHEREREEERKRREERLLLLRNLADNMPSYRAWERARLAREIREWEERVARLRAELDAARRSI